MNRRDFLTTVGSGAMGFALSPLFANSAHATHSQIIRELPESEEKRMAWTVDDGTSIESVKRYIRLVAENEIRLTFFVYSAMGSWLANKSELKPLVESGQIQLANHTAHHPALATLPTKKIQKELMLAHNFIEKNFGVDSKPYFRPPYGSINSKVVEAAADIGYTKPILWSGSFGDASNIRSSKILALAKASFYDRSIVLAHANNLTSSKVFPNLLRIIENKNLTLVTLKDALDD
jgi:peptidoglycan/xylan/chitin deacetylase (PgdA/CDA1 family)